MKFLIAIFCVLIILASDLFSSNFIENKGQWNKEVLFLSKEKNFTFVVHQNGFNFLQQKIENPQSEFKSSSELFSFNFIDADFSKFKVVKESKEYYNFIKGPLKKNWTTNVKSALEIKFSDIYPGIDLILKYDNNQPRYDLIVKPGADPSLISIETNSENQQVLSNGDVFISKKAGNIIQKNLFVYQNNENGKNEIDAAFNLSFGKLKLDLSSYDKSKALIIDPVLYSTFIGGIENDIGEDICVDMFGNTLITGYTSSFNFSDGFNLYQEDLAIEDSVLHPDCFVTKLDPKYELVFTTFIGGVGADYAKGIDCDTLGNIYLTGYTQKADSFPTTSGVLKRQSSGGIESFVLKLSNNGSSVFWSTIIGGSSDDFALDITVEESGTPTITGYTNINTVIKYPVTENSFGEDIEGDIDGFVTKLDNLGESILWSGYLGGLFDDFPQEIVMDFENNFLITGTTRSSNFPTSGSAIDRIYNDPPGNPQYSDAFYTKISGSGERIIYSSFLGGTKKDNAYSIDVDDQGYAYITGATESSNFPVSDFAYRKEINAGNPFASAADAFVLKIDPDGDSLVFSSFVGGQAVDRAYSVKVDENYDVYVTGTTNSYDFPTSLLGFDRSFNDDAVFSDAFILKMNKAGDTLDYSSYLGGELADVGISVDLIGDDNAVITGTTNSFYYPITADAYQSSHQDSLKSDVFFTKILMDDLSDSDYIICGGESVQIESGFFTDDPSIELFFEWLPENEFVDNRMEKPTVSPEFSTQYTCIISDKFSNKWVSLVYVTVVPGVETNISGDTDVPNGLVRIYEAPFRYNSEYEWEVEGGELLTGQSSNQIAIRWVDADNGRVILKETSQFGCVDSDTLYTRYVSTWKMNIVPFGDYDLCDGDSIVFDAGEEYTNIVWNRGGTGRYDTLWTTGSYWFSARDQNGDLYQSKVAEVMFLPAAQKPSIFYKTDSLYFICITAGSSWQWYRNGEMLEGETGRKLRTNIDGNYHIVITNSFGCTNESDVFVINDIKNELSKSFELFPNPANEFIIIRNKNLFDPKASLRIYNQLGKLELETIVDQKEFKLNIDQLNPGVYLIKYQNEIHSFIKL